MNVIAARSALDAMTDGISAALRTARDDPSAAVAEVIGRFAADPMLLLGRDCPCRAETYIRHLLHEDAEEGWAVAALVWRPGQMSPVHGHKAWCAVGVHRGILTETFYEPGEPPVLSGIAMRRPGDITFGPARPDAIHRLANLGTETAISIHAYGLPYARFCTDLNRIHAA
ncbi:cysteine dioxygenase family protein [Neoroseomonas oryzicola]|uniref:Cysteine dioxygenase n=1 Tax=Neoroseomonas oryzicola TaxID=535904 RepID=A0A9X9WP18_9PROT|nr:cysteine dioxygenase family protein [Neoroseomonas oryzicola]MBR0662078.1 cysteine dioxygenase [Neoroseomonas oryzicola]NKE18681.1 cysteine dioxygenase [Neoroseomonas oryzicola]